MRTLLLSAAFGVLAPAQAESVPPPAAEAGLEAADERTQAEPKARAAAGSASPESAHTDPQEAALEDALEVVLPCGLRVVTATDSSLPVAAVVLAIDVGTRDDPKKLRGLVHALAYQLQMGNRSLAPGAALAAVTDHGGWAGMAVGHTQVRYESLVPFSQVDRVLRAEASRLRAPTVNRALWIKSISYARNDPQRRQPVPGELSAAAWEDPALGIDGRRVGKQLATLENDEIGKRMAGLFGYHKASLIVVGPETPEALLARIEPLFAELPAHASSRGAIKLPRRRAAGESGSETQEPTEEQRPAANTSETSEPAAPGATEPKSPDAPEPASAASSTSATKLRDPVVVELPRQRGNTLVWPVAPSADARAWAQALCRTINRQRPNTKDERSRLRCSYADEERRPTLHLRASGKDVTELARARLTRISDGTDSELLATQRDHVRRELHYRLRGALDLAIYLARSDPSMAAVPGRETRFRMAELTGEASLERDDGMFRSIPTLLDVGAAIRPFAPGRAPDPAMPQSEPEPSSGAKAEATPDSKSEGTP
jgi:hypothetical protein